MTRMREGKVWDLKTREEIELSAEKGRKRGLGNRVHNEQDSENNRQVEHSEGREGRRWIRLGALHLSALRWVRFGKGGNGSKGRGNKNEPRKQKKAPKKKHERKGRCGILMHCKKADAFLCQLPC